MQTHVDEIYSNAHMDMKFIEFVEAVARVADKALENKKKKELLPDQEIVSQRSEMKRS